MAARLRAATLAAVLLGWSQVAPRFPQRWNPLPHTVFGAAIAVITRTPMGLRPPALWHGLRWGSAAAVPITLTVAASTASGPVRAGMAGRALPAAAMPWLLLRIPLGTVWSEEVAFRSALGMTARKAFGIKAGRVFAATVFGLSHVPDARTAREPVLRTVLATGAAGWLFAWLYDRSGSLAAPMLTHLAVNEAGAVAALAVQRRHSEHARSTDAARSPGRRSRN